MNAFILTGNCLLSESQIDKIKSIPDVDSVSQDHKRVEIYVIDYHKNKNKVQNQVIALYPNILKPSGLKL